MTVRAGAPGGAVTRLARGLRIAVILAALGGAALAQDSAPVTDLPEGAVLLVLDQERLFSESQFGRESLERQRTAADALEIENSRIEAELVAEEQSLTDRRPQLSAAEFTALAEAFDAKVEQIREAQDAKVRELVDARDADRKTFLSSLVLPVLAEILDATGAMAILNKSEVLVSARAIDVTDAAITRVDRRWSDQKGNESSP